MKKRLIWVLTVAIIALRGGRDIKPIEYKDGHRKEVI